MRKLRIDSTTQLDLRQLKFLIPVRNSLAIWSAVTSLVFDRVKSGIPGHFQLLSPLGSIYRPVLDVLTCLCSLTYLPWYRIGQVGIPIEVNRDTVSQTGSLCQINRDNVPVCLKERLHEPKTLSVFLKTRLN